MLVDVGALLWGLIGIATLVLLVTLVAAAWELRNVLKTAADLAVQIERDLAPTLQDVHHILSRVDQASAVIGEKVEDTANLVEALEDSLAAGRMRARDAWDDTKVWLDSLRVGWQTGLQVWREGGDHGDGHRRVAARIEGDRVEIEPAPTRADEVGEPA